MINIKIFHLEKNRKANLYLFVFPKIIIICITDNNWYLFKRYYIILLEVIL